MYRVIYTHLFEKKIKKFKKDKGLVAELKKKIEKLLSDPFIGKPLEYPLVNFRSIRIKGKYRLFGHRKDIYQLMVLSSKKGSV